MGALTVLLQPGLLHPDFRALRALPLALLMVDVTLELLHGHPAFSARH